MKLLICASAAALALVASPAMAQQSGNYFQANLGLNFAGQTDFKMVLDGDDSLQDDLNLDPGAFGSIAFGHKAGGKWAIEGELVYLDTDVDMGAVEDILEVITEERINVDLGTKTYGVLLNANYEITRSDKTSVYVGGGVGYGKVEYELAVPSEGVSGKADDTGVIWQLKAGVTYDVSPTSALDFGYRYLATPKGKESFDQNNSLSAQTGAHVLTAGLRFSF